MQEGGYKQLLTVSEAATVFGISDRTIQRMIKGGKLAAVEEKARGGRSGVAYMVPLEALPEDMQVKYTKLVRAGKIGGIAEAGEGVCNTPLRGNCLDGGAVGKTGGAEPPLLRGEAVPAQGNKNCLRTIGRKRNELDFGLENKNVCEQFAVEGMVIRETLSREELLKQSGRPKSLEECSEEQRAEISYWKAIIEEWSLFRIKHGSRLEADNRFIDEKGLDISTSSLYRKYSLYKQMGDVGLLDMRGVKNKGKVSIHKELWDLFEGVYLDENRINMAKCYEMVQMWAETKRKELLPIPHYSTFKRAADKIPYALTMLYRYGDKAFEDKAAPYIERIYDSIEPNDVWVADNHTLDIISRQDGTDVRHRLYLTAYIDARSRMFTGWNICLSPNSESNLIALRHGIMRCGLPKNVYVDNGREFLVSDIGGRGHRKKAKDPLPPTILNRLGISMTNAIVRNAKAKVIERQFKEVAQGFSAMFDSFINSNPVARSEKSKKAVKADDLILDSDIREYVNTFLEGYYNQKAHHGTGMKGKSPQAVWEENLTTKRVASEDELNLMMLRTTRYQKVGRNGVKLELYGQAIWYCNNDFRLHWQEKQVYVRYDPNDLRSVRVYDIDDRYIAQVEAMSEMILEYGADKDKISTAMAVKRSFKRHVKGFKDASGIQILKGADRLDILLGYAETKRKPLDSSGALIEIARYEEEKAEGYYAIPKAVGHEDEGMNLSFMLQNALKNKELEGE